MKTRSKESLSHLGDILTKMKPSEFKDNHLAAYKVGYHIRLHTCTTWVIESGPIIQTISLIIALNMYLPTYPSPSSQNVNTVLCVK